MARYSVLKDAYRHYLKTRDKHFRFPLKSDKYLFEIWSDLRSLTEQGYIIGLSDKLKEMLDALAEDPSHRCWGISFQPGEIVYFDITHAGIRFAESEFGDVER